MEGDVSQSVIAPAAAVPASPPSDASVSAPAAAHSSAVAHTHTHTAAAAPAPAPSAAVGLTSQPSLLSSSAAVEDPEEIVETSPQGRYGRRAKLLGRGSFKSVFRGFDKERGCDVAWNEVKVGQFDNRDRKRFVNEVALLSKLSHPHLIGFYGAWTSGRGVGAGEGKLVFITELMSSGTLRDFCARWPISAKQVKRFCKDILECIRYLHTPEPSVDKPVVIHRDLKCDNIFLQHNVIKIGDLGLATTDGRTVLGTPEFMAPEMMEPGYGSSVDIYAFGLCVIEMITGKTPYSECSTAMNVVRKAMAGELPENIRVLEAAWPEAYAFVQYCLTPLMVIRPDPHAAPVSLPPPWNDDGVAAGVPPAGSTPSGGSPAAATPAAAAVAAALPTSAPVMAPASSTDEPAAPASQSADDAHLDAGAQAAGKVPRPVPPTLLASTPASALGTIPEGAEAAASPSTSTLTSATGSAHASTAFFPSTATNSVARAPAPAPATPAQLQSRIYVRPTASMILEHPFLREAPDDNTRNTEKVRQEAAARGFPVVSSEKDEGRRTDLAPPKLPAIPPTVMPPWQASRFVNSTAWGGIAPSGTVLPTSIAVDAAAGATQPRASLTPVGTATASPTLRDSASGATAAAAPAPTPAPAPVDTAPARPTAASAPDSSGGSTDEAISGEPGGTHDVSEPEPARDAAAGALTASDSTGGSAQPQPAHAVAAANPTRVDSTGGPGETAVDGPGGIVHDTGGSSTHAGGATSHAVGPIHAVQPATHLGHRVHPELPPAAHGNPDGETGGPDTQPPVSGSGTGGVDADNGVVPLGVALSLASAPTHAHANASALAAAPAPSALTAGVSVDAPAPQHAVRTVSDAGSSATGHADARAAAQPRSVDAPVAPASNAAPPDPALTRPPSAPRRTGNKPSSSLRTATAGSSGTGTSGAPAAASPARGGGSAGKASSSLGTTPDVETLAAEVRDIRHMVHALYLMVEFLVNSKPTGPEWLRARREKVQQQKAARDQDGRPDGAPSTTAGRRDSKARATAAAAAAATAAASAPVAAVTNAAPSSADAVHRLSAEAASGVSTRRGSAMAESASPVRQSSLRPTAEPPHAFTPTVLPGGGRDVLSTKGGRGPSAEAPPRAGLPTGVAATNGHVVSGADKSSASSGGAAQGGAKPSDPSAQRRDTVSAERSMVGTTTPAPRNIAASGAVSGVSSVHNGAPQRTISVEQRAELEPSDVDETFDDEAGERGADIVDGDHGTPDTDEPSAGRQRASTGQHSAPSPTRLSTTAATNAANGHTAPAASTPAADTPTVAAVRAAPANAVKPAPSGTAVAFDRRTAQSLADLERQRKESQEAHEQNMQAEVERHARKMDEINGKLQDLAREASSADASHAHLHVGEQANRQRRYELLQAQLRDEDEEHRKNARAIEEELAKKVKWYDARERTIRGAAQDPTGDGVLLRRVLSMQTAAEAAPDDGGATQLPTSVAAHGTALQADARPHAHTYSTAPSTARPGLPPGFHTTAHP